MIYNLKNWGVQDSININVFDYVEFQEWARKFNVRTEVLKQALDRVGSKINNVRKYLHDNHFIVAS
jgi:hypothetical protein